MAAIKAIYRPTFVLLTCLAPAIANAQTCSQWREATRAGELQAQLREASGVAVSRKIPGRLYHINDSGDGGALYITGLDGKGVQTVRITGFDPVDAEAVSLGPCPGSDQGSCLYIGDTGDNESKRKSIEVAVIDELTEFPPSVSIRNKLRLRYPDGPHDAESLAVSPSGEIFLLTKENPAKLFKAKPNVPEQTLTFVTTLDVGSAPTDMAISDDGKRMLVLTYGDAVEYSIDFKQHQKIKLNYLQQQESVAYLPGSRSFIYTTEQLFRPLPQWIMRVDCGDGK